MYSYPYPQFVTATILDWKHLLKPDKYKQIIVESFRHLVFNKNIKIYGFVVMPNHIHLIWHLQENGHTREQTQRSLLRFTAQQIKFDLIKNHPAVLERFRVTLKDREYQFWERNPRITDLYSEEVLEQKLIYIHNNPLQENWRLAESAENYYFSSAGYYYYKRSDFDFLSDYRG